MAIQAYDDEGSEMTKLKPGQLGVKRHRQEQAQVCGLKEFRPATGGDISFLAERYHGFRSSPLLVLSILIIHRQACSRHTIQVRQPYHRPCHFPAPGIIQFYVLSCAVLL